jgi:hypothetical protein
VSVFGYDVLESLDSSENQSGEIGVKRVLSAAKDTCVSIVSQNLELETSNTPTTSPFKGRVLKSVTSSATKTGFRVQIRRLDRTAESSVRFALTLNRYTSTSSAKQACDLYVNLRIVGKDLFDVVLLCADDFELVFGEKRGFLAAEDPVDDTLDLQVTGFVFDSHDYDIV